MTPRYSIGDILYYVNPCVFTIEVVKIVYVMTEEEMQLANTFIYIEESHAYLAEEDLHVELVDAKNHAIQLLNRYYTKRLGEIQCAKPDYGDENVC